MERKIWIVTGCTVDEIRTRGVHETKELAWRWVREALDHVIEPTSFSVESWPLWTEEDYK